MHYANYPAFLEHLAKCVLVEADRVRTRHLGRILPTLRGEFRAGFPKLLRQLPLFVRGLRLLAQVPPSFAADDAVGFSDAYRFEIA